MAESIAPVPCSLVAFAWNSVRQRQKAGLSGHPFRRVQFRFGPCGLFAENAHGIMNSCMWLQYVQSMCPRRAQSNTVSQPSASVDRPIGFRYPRPPLHSRGVNDAVNRRNSLVLCLQAHTQAHTKETLQIQFGVQMCQNRTLVRWKRNASRRFVYICVFVCVRVGWREAEKKDRR